MAPDRRVMVSSGHGSKHLERRKYQPDGVEQWTRLFSGDFAAGSAVVDRAGNVFVGGGVDVGSFVLKYDPNGNELWTQRFNIRGSISGFESVNSLATDGAGNVYAAGVASGSPPSEPRSGAWNGYVRKHDANGQEIWTRQFQVAGGTVANDLEVDGSGNVYVVGTTRYPGFDPPSLDVFVRKYDSSGNDLWTQLFGGSERDVGSAVALGGPEVVYVAGHTLTIVPGQISDTEGFLAKFVGVTPALGARQ